MYGNIKLRRYYMYYQHIQEDTMPGCLDHILSCTDWHLKQVEKFEEECRQESFFASLSLQCNSRFFECLWAHRAAFHAKPYYGNSSIPTFLHQFNSCHFDAQTCVGIIMLVLCVAPLSWITYLEYTVDHVQLYMYIKRIQKLCATTNMQIAMIADSTDDKIM